MLYSFPYAAATNLFLASPLSSYLMELVHKYSNLKNPYSSNKQRERERKQEQEVFLNDESCNGDRA